MIAARVASGECCRSCVRGGVTGAELWSEQDQAIDEETRQSGTCERQKTTRRTGKDSLRIMLVSGLIT